MKFRMHRGGTVYESMRSMVEIPATLEAVKRQLRIEAGGLPFPEPMHVEVKRYCDRPDTRIGWERTYLVTVDGAAVAYTDGPVTGK